MHHARRGARSPRPGRASRPPATKLGRDTPRHVLRRAPSRSGAHDGFQICTFGGGTLDAAGTGASRPRPVDLESAICQGGFLCTTGGTLAMQRRRLHAQDALDEVRGRPAPANRHAARAPATLLGRAGMRRRAPVQRTHVPCQLHSRKVREKTVSRGRFRGRGWTNGEMGTHRAPDASYSAAGISYSGSWVRRASCAVAEERVGHARKLGKGATAGREGSGHRDHVDAAGRVGCRAGSTTARGTRSSRPTSSPLIHTLSAAPPVTRTRPRTSRPRGLASHRLVGARDDVQRRPSACSPPLGARPMGPHLRARGRGYEPTKEGGRRPYRAPPCTT